MIDFLARLQPRNFGLGASTKIILLKYFYVRAMGIFYDFVEIYTGKEMIDRETLLRSKYGQLTDNY